MKDGLDFDLDAELEGGSFSIPRQSSLVAIKNASDQDKNEIKWYINNMHSAILSYETIHLNKRYKSYELIRITEETRRFHREESAVEEQEGIAFASTLLEELSKLEGNDGIGCVSALAQKYIDSYYSKKSNTQTFTFPWPTYDDDVSLSCLTLLQQNKLNECRAYMLGYFECICQLPIAEQSSQGKVFTQLIAWATGRHPFRQYYAYISIAVHTLLKRVRIELISGEVLCKNLKYIIQITAQVWILSWSKYCSIPDVKQTFLELFQECLQHVIFITIPNLCQVFLASQCSLELYQASAPFWLDQGVTLTATATADDNVTFGTEQFVPVIASFAPDSPPSDTFTLSNNMQKADTIPGLSLPSSLTHSPWSSQRAISTTNALAEYVTAVTAEIHTPPTSIHTNISNANIANPTGHNKLFSVEELQELCTVPLKFRTLPANLTPFVRVFEDFSALERAKTPGEIAIVAVGIVDKITNVTSSCFGNSPVTRTENDSNLKPSAAPTSSSRSAVALPVNSALCSDDLLPLISFSFALYLQAVKYRVQQKQAASSDIKSYSDKGLHEKMMALIRVGDMLMLNHLTLRREAYALTSCYTALRTLPPQIR